MPFSSGDLPDPGIEPTSPALAGGFFTTEPFENPQSYHVLSEIILRCYMITDEETIGWRISLFFLEDVSLVMTFLHLCKGAEVRNKVS